MARHSTGAWYRKSKNGWYAKIGGKQIPLGIKGIENETAAQRAWHRLMANGAVPEPKTESKQADVPTVFAVIEGFLSDAKGRVKANTYANYKGLLEPVASHFGVTQATALTATKLLAYADRPEWGPSHRHNLIGAVQTAYKWAEANGVVATNPVKSTRRPSKGSRGRKAVVRPEDHAKLLTAATPELRLFLTILYETGARPNELARLTAADVEFGAGIAVLSDHKTVGTTGKPRMIVLTPRAKALLHAQAVTRPTGLLLRNARGTAWKKDGIGLAVRRARQKAGVNAIAYGYRHTFATDALANGVPDATVAALLGHSSTAMLFKHYSHLTSRADVLRQAAAVVRGSAG
jgi:integrase